MSTFIPYSIVHIKQRFIQHVILTSSLVFCILRLHEPQHHPFFLFYLFFFFFLWKETKTFINEEELCTREQAEEISSKSERKNYKITIPNNVRKQRTIEFLIAMDPKGDTKLNMIPYGRAFLLTALKDPTVSFLLFYHPTLWLILLFPLMHSQGFQL